MDNKKMEKKIYKKPLVSGLEIQPLHCIAGSSDPEVGKVIRDDYEKQSQENWDNTKNSSLW